MSEVMIAVDGLGKTYRLHEKEPGLRGSLRSLFRRRWIERAALHRVSFQVHEGEIVGLVGSNGAGKTTLVKMLAGIVHPSHGSARVLGHEPWKRDNEMRQQIALIMGQKAQLWWDLPAADCFLLLREIYQLEMSAYRETLDELAALLDVESLLGVQIRRLSLGERMKMELIAALLHRPRVVFLDEPTIGLDLAAQRAIRQFLLRYRERHRPAMIVTSHYMADIESLCERIVLLRQGSLVYDGSLRAVMERHVTHKVVCAHLSNGEGGPDDDRALAEFGVVLERTPDVLRLRVPRAQVASAAGALLARYPVADLAIEEEELGNVIERLMASQGSPT